MSINTMNVPSHAMEEINKEPLDSTALKVSELLDQPWLNEERMKLSNDLTEACRVITEETKEQNMELSEVAWITIDEQLWKILWLHAYEVAKLNPKPLTIEKVLEWLNS